MLPDQAKKRRCATRGGENRVAWGSTELAYIGVNYCNWDDKR